MDKTIRYADLWALLRELGFDCDTFDDHNHRICDFGPTSTRIVLHDYPLETPVHRQILIGVRLQLDNGSVMSRSEFDRWVEARTKTSPVVLSNGAKAKRSGTPKTGAK